MFVILEALYVESDIDYEGFGVEIPEELLDFREIPINLALIESIEKCEQPKECIIQMTSNKRYQLNITKDKLLQLIDMAGLMLRVPEMDLSKIGLKGLQIGNFTGIHSKHE